MFDNSGTLGEILESGKNTVRDIPKSTKQGTQNFAKTAAGQVMGSQPTQGTNEQANSAQQTQQQQMTDKDRVEFLRNLYGKSDNSSKTKSQGSNPPQKSPISQVLGVPQNDPNLGKTPEELAKIEALRKQLHGDYYQSLTNPQKPQEETVTEKLEREEQKKKMADLETDKEKPPQLSPTQKVGTGEAVIGVSG